MRRRTSIGSRVDRDPGHERLARRLRKQRGQDPHHRRLSGAVRPHQAEDLAGTDDEIDAGDGQVVAVALDEAASLDDRCGGHHSLITPAARALTKTLVWPKFGIGLDAGDPHLDAPGAADGRARVGDVERVLLADIAEQVPCAAHRIAHLERESFGPEPAESALIAEDHRRVGADQDLELGDGHVGRLEREGDAVGHRAVAQDHRARPAVRSHRRRSTARRPTSAGDRSRPHQAPNVGRTLTTSTACA